MKLRYIKVMAVVYAMSLAGCAKGKIEEPILDINLERATYNVGDTIRFKLNGYADYISFYSGEKVATYPTLLGYRYQFKDRALAEGTAYLQFQSLQQNPGQLNSFSVLASSDYNGIYDSLNIYKATWVDITSKVILSDGTLTTATPSGRIDISEFGNKPFFLAFKYKATAGSQQPKWTINNLSVQFYATGTDTTVATKDTFTVATLNPAFRAVNIVNTAQAWSSSTSQLQITGGTATALANEDWAISRDYYLNRVPTDKSMPFKTYTDVMMNEFAYRYTKAGVYNVTFVASNANWKNASSITKSFDIIVR